MRIIIFFLLVSFIVKPAFAQWTGSINLFEKFTGEGAFAGSILETHIDVSFTGGVPTLGRNIDSTNFQFKDDKGIGTITISGELRSPDKGILTGKCNGTGEAQLFEVGFHPDTTYRISAKGPSCQTGTSINLLNGEVTTCCDPDDAKKGTDITIPDQPLGSNHNILSGTYTETVDGGIGKVTRTYTWHLVRSFDAVLIVTPSGKDRNGVSENYDNWLPEPGMDELRKGSVMEISLKVQKKNGNPSTLKATAFNLHLTNSSSEPGITLNFPVVATNPALPDLRFIQHRNAESFEEDQFIRINSYDGSTGKALIGSYDGGGWTTLTVEAILEDSSHIEGHLLVPGGKTEIPIPKRDPGSKIATVWRTANGNPGEMDDKDLSKDNSNNGDGLTAYEEYRGFISEGKFRRLDPNKKELGVKLKRAQFPLFSEGIRWFENGSDINVIRFYETEIGRDRRLNKNASTAHDYDQFALRIENRNLPQTHIGIAYRGPDIPAITDPVIIDFSQGPAWFKDFVNDAKPEPLKFTYAEFLANVVAHEMAHGVSIWHHGDPDKLPPDPDTAQVGSRPAYRIFDRHGNLITARPYILKSIGEAGNQESGDLSCVAAYYPYNKWAFTTGADGAKIFNEVPVLPVGKKMCNSKAGTSINATPIYFGNAAKGNCLSQIKLRN